MVTVSGRETATLLMQKETAALQAADARRFKLSTSTFLPFQEQSPILIPSPPLRTNAKSFSKSWERSKVSMRLQYRHYSTYINIQRYSSSIVKVMVDSFFWSLVVTFLDIYFYIRLKHRHTHSVHFGWRRRGFD